MMTNVLEELYYGNVRPHDPTIAPDSKLASFMSRIAENEQALTEYLNAIPEAEIQRHQLVKLMNGYQEVLMFTDRDRFLAGMQLGAQLMMDLLIVPEKSVVRDIT